MNLDHERELPISAAPSATINATGSSLEPSHADSLVRVRRGPLVSKDALLTVVVMAINADPGAANSVSSLRRQEVSIEIIVVNSGPVSIIPALEPHLDHVIVVETDQLRLPGGTRNLGIREASCSLIAFLAADCEAAPGWARNRIEAHQHDNLAVASALKPTPGPDGRVASASWATYALLHIRRAPESPAPNAVLCGASYHRHLFDRHGLFNERLRIGEDTEFHDRIGTEVAICWAPDVITFHDYPKTMGRALRDAFSRGGDLLDWQRAHNRTPLYLSLRRIYGSMLLALEPSSCVSGETVHELRRVRPAICLLVFGMAMGAITRSVVERRSP